MSEAVDEAEETPAVVGTYVVHTMVGLQTFVGVAEISVGDSAELVLAASDGGCVAMFAPGQWRWVEVGNEVDA